MGQQSKVPGKKSTAKGGGADRMKYQKPSVKRVRNRQAPLAANFAPPPAETGEGEVREGNADNALPSDPESGDENRKGTTH